MAVSAQNSLDLNVGSESWVKSRLRRAGEFFLNYAAILCLVDCIVLPVLITLFRLLDVFPGVHDFERPLHIAEVVLVIPLGLLSVLVNYRKGRKKGYFALGLSGIAIVILGHMFVSGWFETVTSLCGCAALISSNYFSRSDHGCSHCDNHLSTVL